MNNDEGFTEYGMEEEMSVTQTKIISFFKKNIYEIAIVFFCLIRVITGLADLQSTGKSISEIIGGSTLTIVFSLLICRLFEEKGLNVGENAKEYSKAIQEYWELEKEAGKHIKKLDKWCIQYSQERYKDKITTMLYPLGLTFEQYKAGDYDVSHYTKEQKRRLIKIKRTKMHVYTTEELMSGGLEHDSNKDYSKVSKKRYKKISASSDFGMKVIVAFVFGYFTLPPILEWNWAGVLWTLFETAIIFGLSIIKYFNAYTYVNEDICGKIVNLTAILGRFVKDIEEEISVEEVETKTEGEKEECQQET